MKKHGKIKWKAFAPVLSAILMIVCVGMSLSAYSPAVYEVQAMPEEEETLPAEDEENIAFVATTTGSFDHDDGIDYGTAMGYGGEITVAVTKAQDAAAYKDGVYYGSAMGFRGTITVKVTIKNGKITSIEVLSSSDDSEYFNRAKKLISSIIAKQSTNVDVVSGATYSSVGIINAVRDALAKAAVANSSVTSAAKETKTADAKTGISKLKTPTFTVPKAEEGESGAFPYPDGTYYGTGWGYLDGEIIVAVEIKNQSIKSVKIVSAEDQDEPYFSNAKALTSIIVTAQSVDVDVVSGATYSSNGILEAVRNALDEAKTAANANGKSSGSGSGSSGSGKGNGGGGTDKSSGNAVTGDNEDGQEDADDSAQIYKEGTYEITLFCEPDEDKDFSSYEMIIAVTIEGDRIVSMELLSEVGSDNEKYVDYAFNGRFYRGTQITGMTDAITSLARGNVTEEALEDLDTVTGATCTSRTIKAACQEALRQAAEALAEEQNPGDGTSGTDPDDNSDVPGTGQDDDPDAPGTGQDDDPDAPGTGEEGDP